MDLGLQGRRCVVLGGSRGIGRAIVLGLAAEGAAVATCAREPGALASVEEAVREAGGHCHTATCDIADAPSLQAFLGGARDALGGVDVLVHNASALAFGGDEASWSACLQVDLMAGVRACDIVLPWMREAGRGAILLVSSISGLEASPTPDYAYTSVKAAMLALAKKLAIMEAKHGIRVNALAPGSIDFPGGVWDHVHQHQPDFYDAVKGSIPSGRMGEPGEVADVAVFLVSERARWVTGACVAVDGGQHRRIA